MPFISRSVLSGFKSFQSKTTTRFIRSFSNANLNPKTISNTHIINKSLAVILGSLFTGVGLYSIHNYNNINQVQLDDSINSISVLNSVDPLPKKISTPLSNNYDLIGYGIREVSFLKFKVYALGLYICEDDLKLTKEILNSKFIETFYETNDANLFDHRENLSNALNNPKISNILIKNLLSSGVKFTARICAIRNTDLAHFRDGFIRTIKNNPNYNRLMKSDDKITGEKISNGLDELRTVFTSVKMSAKKNSLLFMEITDDQYIKVIVQTTKNSNSNERNDPVVLGVIKEPLITELLFESYLGAEKPLVSSVQTISSEAIVDAVC